ncbi:hypothetical protein A2961_02465 [Candidatus Woesebacteria bacterium RIFCSPLOWO2_01_FULL_39_21]|uniref:Uncharacterized protein n=1 Tax=Candidatus Woesebacteria bacterium RIFCSPLOWO2_01_FULL_39_21 TaxID=1802519 RepID=A0A1F8BEK7_9BACT|nr:MAG: hypothetical protein A2691_04505 [Candidatus Woesebacteria bacterium RIFCSPHIGHO2_01_FULL_39_23]OGM62472.1 MAG: hypothetical protein A2961_02465 [Candidatus Woesebacteria bacterium RIFCSPLOWO2_01_FULL_39_21]
MTVEIPDRAMVEVLTGTRDRGKQRRILPPNTSFYNAKVEAAVARGFYEFADHVDSLTGSEPGSALNQLVESLAGINSVHSVQLPVDIDSLRTLSQTVSRAYDFAEGTELARRIEMGADIFAFTLAGNCAKRITEGDPFDKTLASIQKVMRGLEHLSLIDSDILRQLLTKTQLGSNISMAGLGKLSDLAAVRFLDIALEHPTLSSDQIIDGLVVPAQTILTRTGKFIELAELARRTELVEDEPTNNRRAKNLLPLLAQVADEHLISFGENPQTSSDAAFVLIEAMFAHSIHWTGTRQNVIDLCQYLFLNNHQDTANEVLLQARRAGLFHPPPEELDQIYVDAGVPRELILEHNKAVSQEVELGYYTGDPYGVISEYAQHVGLFLGKQCYSQNGHRAGVAAAMMAINLGKDPSHRVPILVSLNLKDADGNNIRPEFVTRKRLVRRGFQGLYNRGARLTSIDTVDNIGDLIPSERVREYKKRSPRDVTIIRVCGYDRWSLTTPDPDVVDCVFIGLRETNLRDLIRHPDKVDIIQTALAGQRIKLVVLQGTSPISSTTCQKLAASYIGTNRIEPLNRLRSFVHPDNVSLMIAAAKVMEEEN